MIDVIKIIIYGIVEGVTEWLPVSSTGHLIILESIIKFNLTEKFLEMFRVLIQLGAILAVVWLYFKKLNPFDKNKSKEEKTKTYSLWFKVIIASIPAAVIGLLFDDYINKLLFNNIVVSIMLILVGIIFILVENKQKKFKINNVFDITIKTAILIGTFQLLALIPGTSRSGITIIGALLLGVNRESSAEFTFFLGIPVMFGASFLKLLKHGLVFTSYELLILVVGFITAFLVSVLTIKLLLSYIKKNDFKIFAYYRIVLGIIIILFL